MKTKLLLVLILSLPLYFVTFAQEEYKDPRNRNLTETFEGDLFHEVIIYNTPTFKKKPKNVILFIGDGMGIAQIFAGMTANRGQLFLSNFKHCGFSTTQSANDYVTDSAAGGTALACGVKTKNHALGVDAKGNTVENIREWLENRDMVTGIVTTALVNHATPAAFLAHVPERNMYEEIAMEIANSNVDVAIGGGRTHFESRTDGKNCSEIFEAKQKGKVVHSVEAFEAQKQTPVLGLLADMHVEHYPERGQMLSRCTKHTIDLLSDNQNGFFMMVEGSKIDAGGHQNKTPFVAKEMLDFDQAIGVALEFAVQNRETLIIVTADHETGGMANIDGDFETGRTKAGFIYGKHTGTPVPVFAFGPGAELFTGFMDNTEIPEKIKTLLKQNFRL